MDVHFIIWMQICILSQSQCNIYKPHQYLSVNIWMIYICTILNGKRYTKYRGLCLYTSSIDVNKHQNMYRAYKWYRIINVCNLWFFLPEVPYLCIYILDIWNPFLLYQNVFVSPSGKGYYNRYLFKSRLFIRVSWNYHI